jgi:hypothetical protein
MAGARGAALPVALRPLRAARAWPGLRAPLESSDQSDTDASDASAGVVGGLGLGDTPAAGDCVADDHSKGDKCRESIYPGGTVVAKQQHWTGDQAHAQRDRERGIAPTHPKIVVMMSARVPAKDRERDRAIVVG